MKKGKKHYSEAIDCYSRAINQKALNDQDTSLIFSNRAHVNLLLGNYRRSLSDSQDAIKLFPANVKVLLSVIVVYLGWCFKKILNNFQDLGHLRIYICLGVLPSCQSVSFIAIVIGGEILL